MYELLFEIFRDPMQRQEVVGSMLDHLHNMTPSQVRRLFLLPFAVGGSDGDGSDPMGSATIRAGGTCDDVHIVIRKQLLLR
jgi:hypothetical protein